MIIEQLHIGFTDMKGKVRKFGQDGISYLVGDIVGRLSNGDFMVSITVLETGEKLNYPLSKVIEDLEVE